ncbi:MAG: hypothetical protein IT381_19735 [Deltaproteobacteria bacterium]|nr:hypothetical protein [Deltaproteobacteria bacterium]
MVDKIGDGQRTQKSGPQHTTTKDQLKQREAQKARVEIQRARNTDGVASGPLGVGGGGATADAALAPAFSAAAIPREAIRFFEPLGALLLDAPPENVTPSERFATAAPTGLQPTAQLDLGAEATTVALIAGDALDALSSKDPAFAKSEKGEILRAFVKLADAQVQKLAEGSGATLATLAKDPSPTADAARKLHTLFAPIAVSLRAYLKTGEETKDAKGKALADLIRDGETSGDKGDTSGADSTSPSGNDQSMRQGVGDGPQGFSPPGTGGSSGTKGTPKTDPPGKVWAIEILGGQSRTLNEICSMQGCDIEAAIQLLFLSLAKDAEVDLRDIMKEMQVMNEKKSLMRKVQQQYRAEKSRLEGDMRNEYNQLKSEGKIGPDVPFEDYAAWRQVVMGEPLTDPKTGELLKDGAGNPIMEPGTLAEPSPPQSLPSYLGPPAEGGTGGGGNFIFSKATIGAVTQATKVTDQIIGNSDTLSNVLKQQAETASNVVNNMRQTSDEAPPPDAPPPGEEESQGQRQGTEQVMSANLTMKKDLHFQKVGIDLKTTLKINPDLLNNNGGSGGGDVSTGDIQTPPAGHSGRLMSLEQLGNLEQKAKDDLDSLSEMSQMTAMRLQIFMDRRAKFIETLTNSIKKFSQISDGISANLK